VFSLLQEFIDHLKSHLPFHANFIPGLDELGKGWSRVVIYKSVLTAKKHACLIRYGFTGDLFDAFGEQLVEILVMTDFVRVCIVFFWA
jgi:hypothetical protein